MSMKKLKAYIELARIDKPIGIYLLLWPSLLGLFLAGLNSNISLKNILIVILGSLLVRSCGCVINDISDFKIDKLVQRTARRPLATGALNVFEAWVFFFVLSLLSLYLLTFTNTLTIKDIDILCNINSAIPTFQKIHSGTSIHSRNYIWLRFINCLLTSI